MDYGQWIENYGAALGTFIILLIVLAPKIPGAVEAWQKRKWSKEDRNVSKIDQLYERLLDVTERQGQQQVHIVGIIEQNSDALRDVKQAIEQMRIALEREIPQLVASNRDLTERVARMEKRIGQ